jgi:hypothetical protein
MPQRWCQWCICAVTARHNPAEATAIRGFHRPTSITPRPRSSSPVESHVLAPILRSSHAGCADCRRLVASTTISRLGRLPRAVSPDGALQAPQCLVEDVPGLWMCGLHRSKFVIRKECDACVVRKRHGLSPGDDDERLRPRDARWQARQEALDKLNELFREDSS